MTAAELIRVLMALPHNAEIRIGDQTEAGPYLHASVGGVFGSDNGVILCANDDEEWISETPGAYVEEKDMPELPVLWSPPSPDYRSEE